AHDLDTLVLAAVSAGADGARAVTRAANELAADLDGARRLDPASFASLLLMEDRGQLTATQAKQVLADVLAGGGDPADLARARGFEAMGDGALATAVDEVIAASPAQWQRFVDGDAKVVGYFVGQVMKATAGRADGKAVTTLLNQRASQSATP
ncbi:MAG: Asp-tRNA(Asn)/Glu-tRNA(Gln) amidotransferase subunit GatB, partial [Acidimicrobiales bacterium]